MSPDGGDGGKRNGPDPAYMMRKPRIHREDHGSSPGRGNNLQQKHIVYNVCVKV